VSDGRQGGPIPSERQPENRGLVAHVGPVVVDVPRSIGYFGAIGLAVALEVIEWPVGLFIASIPFVKMLNRPKLPQPVRFVEHVLDGAAKPVGGDSEGTIRVPNQRPTSQPPSPHEAHKGMGGRNGQQEEVRKVRQTESPSATSRSRR
jgi:hypothetical protein